MSVLVCPSFVGIPSKHSLDWLQPRSFLQLLTLMRRRPSLPIDHPGLLQKHLFYVLRADHSHVHRHLSLKHQDVPLRPLNAQIAGFQTSLLLHALSPVSMSALQRPASSTPSAALFSICPPTRLPPEDRGHGEKTTLTHSCLLLLPSASTSAFLEARCHQLNLPTLAKVRAQVQPSDRSRRNCENASTSHRCSRNRATIGLDWPHNSGNSA